MRIKSKLRLIVMAAGLALIAPARADVFNLTPFDMYPSPVPGVQHSSFQNSFTTDGTSFDDFWTFDISGPGAQGAGNVSALATLIVDPSGDPQPLGVQLRLVAWNGSNYTTEILSDGGVGLAPFVHAELPPHTGGAPGHGFYAIEVLGITPPGALISTYIGQLQVSAVPEPSMYALLLGGLLLIGWRTRLFRFNGLGSI